LVVLQVALDPMNAARFDQLFGECRKALPVGEGALRSSA